MNTNIITNLNDIPVLITIFGIRGSDIKEVELNVIKKHFSLQLEKMNHFDKNGFTWNELEISEFESPLDKTSICMRIDFNDSDKYSFGPFVSKEKKIEQRYCDIKYLKKIIIEYIIDNVLIINDKRLTEFNSKILIGTDLNDTIEYNEVFKYISDSIGYDIEEYILEYDNYSTKNNTLEPVTEEINKPTIEIDEDEIPF